MSAGVVPARLPARSALALGLLLVVLAFLWGGASGAYQISPGQLMRLLGNALSGGTTDSPEQLVFFNIRLPRLLLAVAAGAGLAVAGALMQGLFRNPLADPGLIGISSGAALAAGVTIVLGQKWFPELQHSLGSWTLMLSAFAGGLGVTLLIYLFSQGPAGTNIGVMLLAGVAVNALAGAGLGYLNFVSTDEQLRNIQFWLLGSLGGARWSAVALVSGLVAATCAAAMACARPLNAIALGEAQAALLGVNVERTKRAVVLIAALAVGAVTATTGIISFVGLIAPHWVRLIAGPDHRVVLPGSALLGAALVLVADAVARTVVQPAELPLGVLTAFIGGPMFLLMLRRFRSRV
ncbi:FecCD family ABC transporter permease [Ottowia sp. VDI28]|uniref:FecCD family ABC transporter permease n=1 Tax=Ottowia sp. VDI28 TaxID=3133968 RepID=UPI003C2DC734